MKQNNILKKEIVDVCKTLYEKDMVSSTGGNFSSKRHGSEQSF